MCDEKCQTQQRKGCFHELIPMWFGMSMGRRAAWKKALLLGHTRAVDAGGTHLCEDLVQPLKGTIKM